MSKSAVTVVSRLLLYWVPAIMYGVLIFFLSSLSSPRTGTGLPDYVLHFCEYAVFSFLLVRAFNSGIFELKWSSLVYGSASAFLYALSDEFHQYFVSGRDASFLDVLWDLIGIVAVIPIFIFFSKVCTRYMLNER